MRVISPVPGQYSNCCAAPIPVCARLVSSTPVPKYTDGGNGEFSAWLPLYPNV
jgi:hypothetical protein